jgi:pimeloyl-ACP methyl ester carboxylesterase
MRAGRATLLAALVLASACASRGVLPRPAAFEEAYVTTPDVRLYVRVVGNGPDTVIAGMAAHLARDLTPLSPGRTLIFFDPRSRGGSDAVRDTAKLGMELEVEDLEAVRTHFRVSRMSLLGWSYHGAVSALYAARYPERVRALVMIGPMAPRPSSAAISGRRGSPPDSADLAYVSSLQQSGMPAIDPVGFCRQATLRQMLRPMMGRPDSARRALANPCIYWNEWPRQVFATIRRVIPLVAGVPWDYTEQARRITAPTLIVHGRNDPNAAVEGGRDWASLIPGARIVELDEVGHAPWLEAPVEFFRVVDVFLARLPVK